MKKNLLQKGQAAILTIFILGMIAVYIGLSQVKLGALESFRGRGSANSLQAYYAANSGIEEAIYQLGLDETFSGTSLTIPSTLPSPNVTVTVTGDDTVKTVKSVAKNGNFVRRIQVTLLNSNITPGFFDAIFAGSGGLYLDNNVVVQNIETGEDADVYSQSFIRGRKNDHKAAGCKNSSSAIYGNATAVEDISKWA